MLFQILDNKQECYGVFLEDRIARDPKSFNLTHTWAPSVHFKDQQVQYAHLWCSGKSLKECCPDELKLAYKLLDKKARAFLLSFTTAGINLNDVCFYDLVPEKFLLNFFKIKNDITQSVFEKYEKPKNYDFLHDLSFFLMDIKNRDLKLDYKSLKLANNNIRTGIAKLKNGHSKVVYNPWTTVTGRLATERNSFPILTMNKNLRSIVKPKNDCFVELDYNAAEVRVLLGLLGEEQPKQDVHEWINKNIFNGTMSRDASKKKVFSWLYNPNAKNKKLNNYLDRDKIYNQYYVDGEVLTPYDRRIKVDREKAVNYLIQSTASDMFLTSAIKINKILKSKKSFISFCIHDSLVLDFALEDKDMLDDISEIFSDTKFGPIKSNLSIGKDFGNMNRVI